MSNGGGRSADDFEGPVAHDEGGAGPEISDEDFRSRSSNGRPGQIEKRYAVWPADSAAYASRLPCRSKTTSV